MVAYRELTTPHARKLEELLVEAQAEAAIFKARSGNDLGTASDFVARYALTVASPTEGAVFGAMDGAELVAAGAVIREEPPFASDGLFVLFVSRSYRRLGVGSGLLQTLSECASTRLGLDSIATQIHPINEEGFAFLADQGFSYDTDLFWQLLRSRSATLLPMSLALSGRSGLASERGVVG